jgi:hypothetical protein
MKNCKNYKEYDIITKMPSGPKTMGKKMTPGKQIT